jgi:hypothetical protein
MPYFLQWHHVSFPHQHGGVIYGDKCGPMENMRPVSNGWVSVARTQDCLVLKNLLHLLRKGGMLRYRAFWRLGESQTLYSVGQSRYTVTPYTIYYILYNYFWPTLYKKSGIVCVCAWSECIHLIHNRTRVHILRFHNQWCMWVEFQCTFDCEVLLWTVCSVSPCLTRSVCSDSFVVGGRMLLQQCWSVIYILTCTLLS